MQLMRYFDSSALRIYYNLDRPPQKAMFTFIEGLGLATKLSSKFSGINIFRKS